MTELRMTPKRLELLQAIADGQVECWRVGGEPRMVRDLGPDAKPKRYARVTAAFNALELAGLAKSWRGIWDAYHVATEITPSGESVLASHREVSG